MPGPFRTAPTRFHYLKYERRAPGYSHAVPGFWDPRPWDPPGAVMTSDESAQLRTSIQRLRERRTMTEAACARVRHPRQGNMIYFGRFDAEMRTGLAGTRDAGAREAAAEEEEESSAAE